MSTSLGRLLVPTLLAGWLGLAGPAQAVYPPPIKDEGKFFSAETLDRANKKIHAVYADTYRDLVVETFPAIPTDLEARYKELGRSKFFFEWARQRIKDLGVNGVYVLICKSPGRVEVEMGGDTGNRAFTSADRDNLVKKMVDKFKDKQFDAGLLEGIDLVESTLKARAGKEPASRSVPGGAARQ